MNSLDEIARGLLLITAALLSIFGLVDIFRVIVFAMLRLPKKGMTLLTDIPNADEAENIIRSVLERVHWSGIPLKLVFIYHDEESRTIADKIISKYPDIGLLSGDDLNYNKNIKQI